MAISYPLTLPSVKSPTRVTLSASSAVTVSRSTFSFVSQVQQFDGQIWLAQVTLPPMARADAAKWIAFLVKLNGQQGTFLLGDTVGKLPQGTANGTPLVNGAGQSGQAINTKGWAASNNGLLLAGDYIQIGQRLHMVLDNVNSDPSGYATFDIWPQLRESPGNNSSVVTSSCVGLFRLAGNTSDIFDASADRNYAVNFQAVEAL